MSCGDQQQDHAAVQPLVSCIIAVYNGSAYLREAVDSAINQDYQPLEIIVVDDGSTDGTADIITSYGNRIISIHQRNCGVSVARNRGVAASAGALICFLDADDVLEPHKIKRQVEIFSADEQLDFCDCHADFFWSPEIDDAVVARDRRYAQDFWRKTLPRHISTWLLRRKLWDAVGGFSAELRYAEDVDWLSRARDIPMRLVTLDMVLAHRRLHGGNTTSQNHTGQAAALADALMAHVMRKRSAAGSMTTG